MSFPLNEMGVEFNSMYGLPVRSDVTLHPEIDPAELDVAVEVIREEFDELVAATGTYLENFPIERPELDILEAADALGDIIVASTTMAVRLGIDIEAVLRAIRASNLSKLGEDGRPIHRADGKVLKGPNFQPPKIAEALGLAEAA